MARIALSMISAVNERVKPLMDGTIQPRAWS